MKSTRKHELQTNELADALGHFIEKAKPHAPTIGLAALAVIVLVVALVILPAIRGSTADRAAAAFSLAQGVGDAQAVRKFVEAYPDSPQAPTARLLLAERLVAEAVSGTGEAKGTDAKPAELLKEAKEMYGQVATSSEALKPLAEVGLALLTVHEGDIAKGRAALQEVITKWPNSTAAEKARAHVEALAGYVPTPFSDEPLEEPKPPAEGEGATKAEPDKTSPAQPDAKPADPKPAEEPKAAPAAEPKAKPADAAAKPVG